MPTYDYVCPQCEVEEEHDHRITEDPQIVCAYCGADMKRQISKSTSFVLKGTGWFDKGGY